MSKDNPSTAANPRMVGAVNFECIYDKAVGEGTMCLKLADLTGTITEDGVERGHIAGCLGGAIEVVDNKRDPGRIWVVRFEELWEAFQSALTHCGVPPSV